VTFVAEELAAGRGGWIVTANTDHVRRMALDVEFASLCFSASLLVADGMPIVWASRLQGEPVPERVTGCSLTWTLSEMAAAHERSVYLLGGAPGTVERAARVLQRQYPALRVAGVCCPDYGFETRPDEMRAISEALVAAQPDIVYVALGSPKADWFINVLRPLLPKTWWIGVGISFSFISGEITRAPAWMQRAALEWLHRVMQEPARLTRRYFIDDAPFAAALLTKAAWSRLRRTLGMASPVSLPVHRS
jgi:N-acetylglucosaminyldiphosphoundecaprenol N-acetyl-beta-D-mannosaminyltransferase